MIGTRAGCRVGEGEAGRRSAPPSNPGTPAWSYIGIPYVTAALPGVASDSTSIPIMPTLPEGAYHTACDWYSGNVDSYDPCTIETPTPPTTQTTNEYVVNMFAGNASDSNAGGYGTVSEPRLTLPSATVLGTAGVKIFVYGDGTPYPADAWTDRKTDYIQWRTSNLTAGGTSANPVWIVGINNPRLETREKFIGGTHLIMDGIIYDGTYFTSSKASIAGTHLTFRNGGWFGQNMNPMLSINDSRYVIYYNMEIAYNGIVAEGTGYNGTIYQDGTDRHLLSPDYRNQYVWVIECNVHHAQADGIQIGNSDNPNTPQDTSHYIWFAGNDSYSCGENSIDNKDGYHCVYSQNRCWDNSSLYNPDGGQCCITTQDNEGTSQCYRWFLFNEVFDCQTGIVSKCNNEPGRGATYVEAACLDYIIGNLVYDFTGTGMAVQAPAAFAAGIEHHFENNTVIGTGTQVGMQIAHWQPDTNQPATYFHNNLIYNCATDINFSDTVGLGYMESTDSFLYKTSGSYVTGAYWDVETNTTTGQDPLFTSVGSNDYSLQSGSPALANGTIGPGATLYETLYGISIAYDFNGNSRPTNWAAGAFE